MNTEQFTQFTRGAHFDLIPSMESSYKVVFFDDAGKVTVICILQSERDAVNLCNKLEFARVDTLEKQEATS